MAQLTAFLSLLPVASLLACGPNAPPVNSPAAAGPATESPAPGPAGATRTSSDGLYTCHQPAPSTPIEVTLVTGFTARDVVTWYLAVSCHRVVVPRSLASRASAEGVHTRTTGAGVDELFGQLLAKLELGSISQGNLTVIVDLKSVADLPGKGPGLLIVPATAEEPPVELPAPAEKDAFTELLDNNITKLSETHYEITRELVEKIQANPMSAAKGARVVPSVKGGKGNGFKVYAMRPLSLYVRLGFKNGDTIHSINGLSLASPDEALRAYSLIKQELQLEIALTRRGQPVILTIDIK